MLVGQLEPKQNKLSGLVLLVLVKLDSTLFQFTPIPFC